MRKRTDEFIFLAVGSLEVFDQSKGLLLGPFQLFFRTPPQDDFHNGGRQRLQQLPVPLAVAAFALGDTDQSVKTLADLKRHPQKCGNCRMIFNHAGFLQQRCGFMGEEAASPAHHEVA